MRAQPAPEPAQPARHALDDMDPDLFVFPRLQYITLTHTNDEWDAHPHADDILLDYAQRVTNIKITKRTWEDRVVRIDDFPKFFALPFIFMTGQGNFHLTDEQVAAIGEYFKRGGFIYADECVEGRGGDIFYRAFIREITKALPGSRMEPVPHDHEIYHCFYDFDNGAPFCKGRRHPDMGLFYNDRLVAFLTSGDVHCGWANVTTPYGLQEPCLQMGVNIMIFALTH